MPMTRLGYHRTGVPEKCNRLSRLGKRCRLRQMKSLAGRTVGWLYRSLIWDPSATVLPAWLRVLWAARKLLFAVALTIALTWREWVEHHPPEIGIITVIHFVFVMMALALVVRGWQWMSGAFKKAPTSS